MVLFAMKGR